MKKNRIVTGALALAMALTTLTATAARADHKPSSKEKALRVGTYVGAAAAAYGLIKGKPGIAVAGAAGAYVAERARKNEEEKRRYGRYDRDYRYDDRYSRDRDYRYDRDYDSRYDDRYDRDYDYRDDYRYRRSSDRRR